MSNIIFVNQDKFKRAQNIVALLSRDAKNAEEAETKEKFAAFVNEGKIDIKKDKDKDGAIQFVYEKLGGLIRTQEQQKKIKGKTKAQIAKEKKEKEEEEGTDADDADDADGDDE